MSEKQKHVNTSPHYSVQLRKIWVTGVLLMITFICSIVYLAPFGNMFLFSLKTSEQQVSSATGNILPVEALTFEYEGQKLNIYNVPDAEGVIHQWALVNATRRVSTFIDPENIEAGLVEWEGNWRGLEPVTVLAPHWENYQTAWDEIEFPRVFMNTLYIAVVGMIGTIISSILVAYAFARFPIPGKNILFIILIGTIILPGQVTLIPTFAFFSRAVAFFQTGLSSLGLPEGIRDPLTAFVAYLPLTLPHFFSNAYNVFLLRQFFMTLPRELDEAAMIDGAGPLRILIQVIMPMAWPAVITVGLFHFIFAWNDYFGPLIYLLQYKELQPISIALASFNALYGSRPELIQATALMGMVLPLVIFFLAQRIFMRGVVITGVEK